MKIIPFERPQDYKPRERNSKGLGERVEFDLGPTEDPMEQGLRDAFSNNYDSLSEEEAGRLVGRVLRKDRMKKMKQRGVGLAVGLGLAYVLYRVFS